MKIKKPFFLLLMIILAIIVFLLTNRFIILIISCLFLSYLIKPLFLVINSFINNKSLSAFFSEFIFFTGLIFIIVFIINSLLSQLVSVSSPLLAENLINLNFTILSVDFSQIDFENSLTQETLFSFSNVIKDLLFQTPLLIIDIFLLMFITYYFVKSSDKIYNTVIEMIPSNSRDNLKRFIKKIDILIREILYGYFLTGIFIGLLTFILLNILSINYSFDYALLSGLASLIPVIGNWIFPIFLSIYFLFNNRILISIILIIFAVMSSYLINMFRLIISKSNYKIHPILFIIGVVTGFYSLGFLGFLIGPILFGVVQSGFEELIK